MRIFCLSFLLSNQQESSSPLSSFSLSLSLGFGGGTASSSSLGRKKNRKNKKKPKNSHKSKYESDVSETTRALVQWLNDEEVEGLDDCKIGFGRKGENIIFDGDGDSLLRGIFARRDFVSGEYIMAVPFVSTLLVDESFEVSSSSNSDVSVSDNFKLRAGEPIIGLKFWQQFLNKKSNEKNGENNNRYTAYLDCLPMESDDPNFDSTPDFWSDEDIRKLEIPTLVDKMLSRKREIEELVRKPYDDAPSSFAALQQACYIVQTRAFTTYKKAIDLDGNTGLLSRVVLIPFIDMLNHASRTESNAKMEVVETKEYDESFYALVATTSIPMGSEIKINYGSGEETSFELFCRYGFLPSKSSRNDHDDDMTYKEQERAALENLVLPQGKTIAWSTSLEDDLAALRTNIGRTEPMRSILLLRIEAKSCLL